MGILIGVFCVAIFTDWRFYRIPNICILAGMAAGLIMTYVSYSGTGLLGVLAAVIVIFMAFYPFYLLGALGAGDVKLFMMMCCWLREEALFHYMLVTMLTAAAVSVTKMVLYPESRERLFYLVRYVRKMALTGVVDDYETDMAQKRCVVRLSVPAFISLLLMCAGVY